jgi:hypothetical protein
VPASTFLAEYRAIKWNDGRTPVGAAGPPLEAYSRVTNPERFASLRDSAAGLLHRLEGEFETERTEAYGLDPEFEHDCNLSRPSVALLGLGSSTNVESAGKRSPLRMRKRRA